MWIPRGRKHALPLGLSLSAAALMGLLLPWIVLSRGEGGNGQGSLRALPPNPTGLTLVAESNGVSVGAGQAVVTATIRDAAYRPVSSILVQFGSTLGSVTAASITTDNSGQATTTFQARSQAGQATITATCCNGLSQEVLLQVAEAPMPLLQLAVGAPQLLAESQTVITATLRDEGSGAMPGEVVTFFGSLGVMTPGSGLTDANGQAVATFTAGPDVGQATITVLTGQATASTQLQIQSSGIGDIDGDGDVDMFDIQAVASNWLLAVPEMDLDGDGLVTIRDIMQVAGRFSQP